MCQMVQDIRTCLIRHTKGPGKCVGLYRMSENSGFILVNRNTLGLVIFVGCPAILENSGVGIFLYSASCNVMESFWVMQHSSCSGVISMIPGMLKIG